MDIIPNVKNLVIVDTRNMEGNVITESIPVTPGVERMARVLDMRVYCVRHDEWRRDVIIWPV